MGLGETLLGIRTRGGPGLIRVLEAYVNFSSISVVSEIFVRKLSEMK